MPTLLKLAGAKLSAKRRTRKAGADAGSCAMRPRAMRSPLYRADLRTGGAPAPESLARDVRAKAGGG
jgi:hypothetical protein